MEILEVKVIIIEMKDPLEKHHSRLYQAEKINKLHDNSIEIIQSEEQKKRNEKNEQSPGSCGAQSSTPAYCTMRVPERNEREKGSKKFEI